MRLAILLLLAVAIGRSQAPAPSVLNPTAQLLDRYLRGSKTSVLVVVDGPKSEWRAKIDALNSDPEWIELNLTQLFFVSNAVEVEAFLRQKFQAGPRPHWVLFGEGGRAVATGGNLPEPKAMQKLIEESGVRTQIQVLREFTRQYPDHLEARVHLCDLLRTKAGKRTLLLTGGKLDPTRPSDEAYDPSKAAKEEEAKEEAKAQVKPDEKPPAQLGVEEDQSIWGELADLGAKSFSSGDWLEVYPWSMIPPEEAVHSPCMQEMSRAAIPEVERALARTPTSWTVWQVWLGLTRTFGGKPIRPLLDSLMPVPTNHLLAWPPDSVRDAYVKDARKRKDWTGIKDLLLPQIEINRLSEAAQDQKTENVLRKDGQIQENTETGDYWRSTLEPLVEALLWLGDSGQADDLVRDRFGKHPWSGLPTRAAGLALRCNQPNLAAQWRALGGGK